MCFRDDGEDGIDLSASAGWPAHDRGGGPRCLHSGKDREDRGPSGDDDVVVARYVEQSLRITKGIAVPEHPRPREDAARSRSESEATLKWRPCLARLRNG
jgi:hypothetical protein